jgi:putative DNA primase/helicase
MTARQVKAKAKTGNALVRFASRLLVPEGYKFDEHGTYRLSAKSGKEVWVPIAEFPVIIARVLEHVNGDYRLELMWGRGPEARTRAFKRGEVMKSTKLVDLAEHGLPVTSNNAASLVSYLSRFEAVNIDRLPHVKVTGSMGWQEHINVFLWGAETFSVDGTHALELEQHDGDATNLVKACTAEGTAAGWKQAAKKLQPYPVAVTALTTSLASPLLKVLGREGFITDMAGKSSIGKTIAEEAGASVWGQPNPKSKESITVTWNSTSVGVELMAERRGSLPMILDDTMTVRNPKELEKLIYQQTAGRGRTRGRGTGGLRHEPVWLSTMISTGEQALPSYSQASGAQARVLSFQEPPFGPRTDNEDSKEFVNELRRAVREHFGHAGPALVKYVTKHHDEWPAWRKRCVSRETELASEHEGLGTVDRQADFYATLFVTGELAYKAGVLPFDPTPTLEAAWQKVIDEASGMDKARAAWLDVISWIDSHSDRFRQRQVGELSDGNEPFGGWAGYQTDTYVGFYPPLLKKVLENEEYGYEATLRAWREEGFIDAEPGNLTKKLHVGGRVKARLVLLKRSVIEGKRDG